MAELNKKKIFASSPNKAIRKAFTELTQDFNKMNAIKYKELYENESMSFILNNSRYIYAEPYRGRAFYLEFISNNILPLDSIFSEREKLSSYIETNGSNMYDGQLQSYTEIYDELNRQYEGKKKTIEMQKSILEDTAYAHIVYDMLYEHKYNDDVKSDFIAIFKECNEINLLDFMNIVMETGWDNNIKPYIEGIYYENPQTIHEYQTNVMLSQLLRVSLSDTYFKEQMNSLRNMTARDVIFTHTEISTDFIKEHTSMKIDNIIVSESVDLINEIYEENSFKEEIYAEDKLNRLLFEKEMVDLSLSLMHMSDTDDINFMAEYVSEIKGINIDKDNQLSILNEFSNEIDQDINILVEKYFSADGKPSKVITGSLGYDHKRDVDKEFLKPKEKEEEKKKDDDDDDDDDPYAKGDSESLKKTIKKHDDATKIMSKDDDDDDDDSIERVVKKHNDMVKHIKESEDITEASKMVSAEKDDGYKYHKVEKKEKPKAKNVFQSIQNKALDTDVQFKKKVAEGKRTVTDMKNAGKASTKIPKNIFTSVKDQLEDWDEMDDDRRKKYILQPGFRKKYFKTLRWAIMHYAAFAINPVLNIVLLMGKYVSGQKDIRIRNEFTRELQAESKILAEKIEDAKSKGDDNKKYKMMRYKEKIDAEIVRVTANTKFV